MFNSKAIKKLKSEMDSSKDVKSMSKYTMEAMKPEVELEVENKPKKSNPETKLEIDVMLKSARKKK